MARNSVTPRRESPSDLPRQEVEAESGVAPLKAIHQIVFGAAQTAVPNSFFTPVSEAERNELLASGAAVELDEVESVVLTATSTAAETPASDSDVIGA